MARVKLIPGIESLSGTIGDVTFRTMNGKTFMHRKAEPVLPPHATRKQKAQYKKRVIVNDCVVLVQAEMENVFEALEQRSRIYDTIRHLYDRYAPGIKARTKLQRAILSAYWERKNTSEMHRENIGNGSVKGGRDEKRE